MPDICIFIPAYNAEQHLYGVVKRVPVSLWDSIKSIWIINDGSSDNTGAVIERLKQEYSCIRSITFDQNKGYGHAVKAGLWLVRNDRPDYAFCLHADGQYPPERIPAFLEAAKKNNLDLIQGSRMAPGTALQGGMPLYKYAAGKVLTALENMIFRMKLSDYHSGYLCYSSRALRISFHTLSNSFEFDLEVIASARKQGLNIGELGIPTHYGDEDSHLNPIGYGFRVLRVLGKYLAGDYGAVDMTPHSVRG